MFTKEKTTPYSYPLSMRHVLRFDSTIDEPEYYSEFCDVLLSATEDDVIEMYFSTDGGNGSSMIAIMNLMNNCRAKIVGYLLSDAHSAGSYLFLKCDEHFVGEHTSMLCHTVSYGVKGSHPEILDHVLHADKHEKNLVKSTYKNFLTDDEINKLLDGKQVYLDSEEIRKRLQQRSVIRQKEEQEAQQEQMSALEEMYASPPKEVLAKLTKAQLIAYIADEVYIDVKDDGSYTLIDVDTDEE